MIGAPGGPSPSQDAPGSDASIEIFGGGGVGKSTLIREEGWTSSREVFLQELDRLLGERLRERIFIPFPRRVLRGFRDASIYRYEEEAMRVFASDWREFVDLCLLVIFNSPVSAERRIRCYRFFMKAVLSWWLVDEQEGLIWDESFAKATMYACAMAPDFSDSYFKDVVAAMPKRGRYILLDGNPEQSVEGQTKRGKFPERMSPSEREEKLRSAAKYRAMARRLCKELRATGHTVVERSSKV
jgi:hypothetical protein